jgi:hypothetical protein
MTLLSAGVYATIVLCGLIETAAMSDLPNAAGHYRKAMAAVPQVSADEQIVLDDYTKDPLSEKANQLLEKAALSLREARLGAQIKRCDWGPWTEKELSAEDGRFMPTAQIGRLFCLSARAKFRHGEIQPALDELMLALQHQSDSGRHGPFIARVVQQSIEGRVIKVIEGELAILDTNGLQKVERWLMSLPDRGLLTDAASAEEAFIRASLARTAKMSDQEAYEELRQGTQLINPQEPVEQIWKAAGRNGAGLVKLFENSLESMDDLNKIQQLPSDRAVPTFAQAHKRFQRTNPAVCPLVTAFERVRWAEDRILCRFTMLKGAVAIRLHGKEALGDSKDPYGKPILFEPTNTGFQLRSETTRNGDPLAVFTVSTKK